MTYAAMTVVPIIKAAVFSPDDHSAVDYILRRTDWYLEESFYQGSPWEVKNYDCGGIYGPKHIREGDVVVVKDQKVKVLSFSEFEKTYRIV